jgi:hypothetical protein
LRWGSVRPWHSAQRRAHPIAPDRGSSSGAVRTAADRVTRSVGAWLFGLARPSPFSPRSFTSAPLPAATGPHYRGSGRDHEPARIGPRRIGDDEAIRHDRSGRPDRSPRDRVGRAPGVPGSTVRDRTAPAALARPRCGATLRPTWLMAHLDGIRLYTGPLLVSDPAKFSVRSDDTDLDRASTSL